MLDTARLAHLTDLLLDYRWLAQIELAPSSLGADAALQRARDKLAIEIRTACADLLTTEPDLQTPTRNLHVHEGLRELVNTYGNHLGHPIACACPTCDPLRQRTPKSPADAY